MKIYSAPTPLVVELSQEEASDLVHFLVDALPDPDTEQLRAREVVALDLYKRLRSLLVDY